MSSRRPVASTNRARRPPPVLAVTLGDPCGIGPEVVLRALNDPRAARWARYVLVGSDAVLRRVAERLDLNAASWRVLRGAPDREETEAGPVLLQTGRAPASLALRGEPTKSGGAASVLWIRRAVELVAQGAADGLVTAPISKDAVRLAGGRWPGHTELLAELTGVRKPVMMMAGAGLRVALVTTHVAMRDLPSRITKENVLETVRITARDLKKYFGVEHPRLRVCGLNPHAGEGGRFGAEEELAIGPAVEAARSEGILCEGPFPADTVYIDRHRKRYDAVVAMYHDQACIPVKMLAFDRGVNVTLGLPVARTSPDHGTAYDIVNRGVADPGSMLAAIRTASQMARAAGRRR